MSDEEIVTMSGEVLTSRYGSEGQWITTNTPIMHPGGATMMGPPGPPGPTGPPGLPGDLDPAVAELLKLIVGTQQQILDRLVAIEGKLDRE